MKFKKSPAYKYINYGISFGLTMAITVYVLFLGGSWLDDRAGTYPLFTFLGVILAIATVFKRLLTDLRVMERQGKEEE